MSPRTVLVVLALVILGCKPHGVSHPIETDAHTVGKASHPIDPEALGLNPVFEPSPETAARLRQDALSSFSAVLGKSLPQSFSADGTPTGWVNQTGELRQLRASAKMAPADFRTRLPTMLWQEVPIPPEYLAAMHLPPNVPKSYMTCFAGQISGKPAYLFWSESSGTLMLVLDY